MSFDTSVLRTFQGRLVRPVGAAGDFSPFSFPVLISQKGLSSVTTGRGAFVPSLGIIFIAIAGTGNLLRFSTVTDSELAPLAVTGGVAIRSVAFNPSNGFLYTSDGINARKVDPVTGASTLLVFGGGDISDDVIYDPFIQAVHFTGALLFNVVRFNNAGVLSQEPAFPRQTRGITYAPVTNERLAVALNTGAGVVVVNPDTGIVAAGAATGGGRAISFGPTSKLCVECAFASLQSFDPLSLLYAPLPMGVPPDQLHSLSYSPLHNAHVMDGSDTGILYFISDGGATGPFGSLIAQINVGPNVAARINDSFAVSSGSKLYVPTTNPPKMNIFS